MMTKALLVLLAISVSMIIRRSQAIAGAVYARDGRRLRRRSPPGRSPVSSVEPEAIGGDGGDDDSQRPGRDRDNGDTGLSDADADEGPDDDKPIGNVPACQGHQRGDDCGDNQNDYRP